MLRKNSVTDSLVQNDAHMLFVSCNCPKYKNLILNS